MSREFGNYCNGCGYFHSRMQGALEDAETGTSNGAKLMVAFLKPLADMAYAVASEEAGDASEPNTQETFYNNIANLRTALHAAEQYVEGAKRVAAEVLADAISKRVEIKDEGGGSYSVRAHHDLMPKECQYDTYQRAIELLVYRQSGSWALWRGSSWKAGSDYSTHHVQCYNKSKDSKQVDWMYKEIQRLKNELAAAKVGVMA